MSDSIKTPIGRTSYAFLHGEGDPKEKGACKFKATLMLPKSTKQMAGLRLSDEKKKAWLKEINDFIKHIRTETKDLATGSFRKKAESSKCRWDLVLDGDEYAEAFEGNKGFWLIRMKTKFKVKIAKPKRADGNIEDGNDDERDGFYSGCWARFFINLYTYDVDGNFGVGAGLVGCQKAFNDEPLSSGASAEFDDDIEELDDDEDAFDDDDDDVDVEEL